MPLPPSLDFASLRAAYAAGLTPSTLVEALLPRLAEDRHGVWISRVPDERLRDLARALEARDPASLPLYGLPFAIKDNIDLVGLPTTAACPAFAYRPAADAPVVEALLQAGALPLGKTNLDQFATGLNGTRSPYGVCRNAFDTAYISGGSSSGSAVAVALGLASFSLGTDTAGSGRVPAAFNNIVGLKPTRGTLSARGVVPACRSLDSVSIFTLTAADAAAVHAVVARFDAEDEFARPLDTPAAAFDGMAGLRLGIPRQDQLEFAGDGDYQRLFAAACAQAGALGATLVEIDFAPFLEAARLLYGGPWIAERAQAPAGLLRDDPEALLPVIREILAGADRFSAGDLFRDQQQLARLRRAADNVLAAVDAVLTPTAPTIFTIAEIEAEPVARNTLLGTYTNFMNLLDCAAIALPAGRRRDGLPFGVTFFAPAHQDRALLALGRHWQAAQALPPGAPAA